MQEYSADVFQAIADPNRREILNLLSAHEMPINLLAAHFDMSRPAVSKHIKILETAGFIVITQKGRERYCELEESGFNELQNWLTYYEKFWNNKMHALAQLMNEQNPKKKGK